MLTIELREAFIELDSTNRKLHTLLANHTGQMFLPPHYRVQDPSLYAANQICNLWHSDSRKNTSFDSPTLPRSGLFCVTPEIAQQIALLNTAKDRFKEVVVDLRKLHGVTFNVNSHLSSDHAYKKAMTTSGLSRLDLVACYRHAPLITEEVQAFRFFWNTSHRRVGKVTVGYVRNQLDDQTSAVSKMALNRISHLPDDHFLAEVKPHNPQLKANLVTADNKRSQISCSSVILLLADTLPDTITWQQPKQDKKPRKARPSMVGESIAEGSYFHFYLDSSSQP